jgi:hypothetical protein
LGFVAVITKGETAEIITIFTINGEKVANARIGFVVAWEAIVDPADADFLIIAERSGKVRLWEVPTRRPVRILLDIDDCVTCIHYAPTAQKSSLGQSRDTFTMEVSSYDDNVILAPESRLSDSTFSDPSIEKTQVIKELYELRFHGWIPE